VILEANLGGAWVRARVLFCRLLPIIEESIRDFARDHYSEQCPLARREGTGAPHDAQQR
jgi:hypothetical protein